MCQELERAISVIPAHAGIHLLRAPWTPASAGVTDPVVQCQRQCIFSASMSRGLERPLYRHSRARGNPSSPRALDSGLRRSDRPGRALPATTHLRRAAWTPASAGVTDRVLQCQRQCIFSASMCRELERAPLRHSRARGNPSSPRVLDSGFRRSDGPCRAQPTTKHLLRFDVPRARARSFPSFPRTRESIFSACPGLRLSPE